MRSRQQRALRGAIWAGVATLLAATSHTLAGGDAPAILLVAAMAVLLTPVAGALARPRPGLGRLATTVTVSQVAFHAVFQLLGSPIDVSGAGSASHAHHPLVLTLTVADVPPPGAGMYAAHAVAALLTVALLWRGEHAVRSIARATAAVLRRAETPRVPVTRPPVLTLRPTTRRGIARAVLSPVSRRGPPAALGA
ncbi:hypothetical protein [Microbacterium marinilacus]|uniref:MFS transporter n=1 Tax=Microbacterium marinilacus TaxID=415209 RepID=A0ABP7B071_9MICO|nr:hypothetical protein [Microbacterium marinilacus]MBY0690097.1 hypothetical protein [Microbacterium marinilacus]